MAEGIELSEEKIIEERKEKVKLFFKNNPNWIFIVVLIFLIILGFYIRVQPLTDHNPNFAGLQPGLWDITTNDYTLGPDLDPFLFLRYAKTMITDGGLPQMDMIRNVPLGFDPKRELQMVAYMIILTYKIVNFFGSYSINFAGAFMPVIFFALTIISFFLFVREIFIRKDDKQSAIKAGIIASISTLFMTIIPAFLSRTVAGIPEKESIAFFFMFLAFYLFIKAWKSEKLISSCIFGVLAGASTGLMGLSWGGVTYVYITIGLSGLAAFILNKFGKKETLAYGLWLFSSAALMLLLSHRFNIKEFVLGFDTGVACATFAISLVHIFLWNTNMNKLLGLERIKIPKTVISIVIVIALGIVASFLISPTYIIDRVSGLYETLIKPITGRWSTTVAENRQPYFTEWFGSFGKAIFWLFFIGSALLFNKMLDKLKKNDRWILTGLYVLFFFGLVFSRYAPHPAVLDGENLISKLFYFGSALLLVGSIIYYYINYHKENDFSFEKIEFEYIFLFVLFVLTLFTARSAVRLIMVLVPIAPIFLSYLIVELGFMSKKEEKKDLKIVFIILFSLVLLISAYYSYNYYNGIKAESYSYTPYYYTFQWQKAMAWVRNNTSENAVFAHWWDYGYWVQSMGNRATVTDGGNLIVWWNYLTGRLVLTGDNQKDSLEFLWNHNATHLLIDSSDIGKYGAFSQIGSDINYDRLSQGPISLISNQAQMQETKNETIRTYFMPSGDSIAIFPLEEDIIFENNGSKVNLFKEKTGFLGVNVRYSQNNKENNTYTFKQPEAIFTTQTGQISVPMRYIYSRGKLLDFKTGIEAAVSLIDKVDVSSSNQLSIDSIGAAIYLSPRILRGFLGQVYILDGKLGKFPNFNLVHDEPDFIIDQINQQGANLGDFVYYQGLRGPIKIWSIKYTGEEKVKEDYLRITPPDYITWSF